MIIKSLTKTAGLKTVKKRNDSECAGQLLLEWKVAR